jgi:protease I
MWKVAVVLLLCTLAVPSLLAEPARIVMVIAPRDFTDQEYSEPREVFEASGATVTTCSTSRQPAVSRNGVSVTPDCATADLRPAAFDAIVVVGGAGASTYLLKDEPLRNALVAASARHRVIAAICLGPVVLAQAGLLRNVPATCFPDAKAVAFLKQKGASYSDRTVVVSGLVVTGNGPAASREFARRVLEVLAQSRGTS